MEKLLTLTIIHQHPRVLLGMKKRGFGAGRWNGFGGKVLAGETIEQAAQRELQEEAGISAEALEKIGILDFVFQGNPEVLRVHVFRADAFSGEPTESEEMRPQWFPVDAIPFAEIWPDDVHWVPLFLRGQQFKGRFLFGESDVILEQELIPVSPSVIASEHPFIAVIARSESARDVAISHEPHT